jgi:hypothetical protein
MSKAAVLISILLSVLLLSCGSSIETSSSRSRLSASVTYDGMTYVLSLPKSAFGVDDNLTGTFQILNVSEAEREFHFGNNEQFGFVLTNSQGDTVLHYPWVFKPILTDVTLANGEKKDYKIRSRLADHDGQPFPPGRYTMQAYLLDNEVPKVIVQITLQ